ncbi:dTMP kinase [Listeria seeligeri]|uniref:dTMP kinase n=2 Tax=Listeria seeligeri TaxID=1640 RepID=UPI00162A1846|nr:dTMP kinase [Listeria seeligeri]MBC1727345.1 dTMP kinase [Listeria seeligeri]
MFIILEGLDNAGKTTAAEIISEHFRNKGMSVYVSKELTTNVGIIIKELNRRGKLSSITKTFLFAADRQIRLEEFVKDSENYDIIIMDRYIYSAMSYRVAEGTDLNWVKVVNDNVKKSDLAYYIDISPEESINRNSKKKFNIKYSLEYLEKVRYLYKELVRRKELILIDGMRSIEDVTTDIIKSIEEKGAFLYVE